MFIKVDRFRSKWSSTYRRIGLLFTSENASWLSHTFRSLGNGTPYREFIFYGEVTVTPCTNEVILKLKCQRSLGTYENVKIVFSHVFVKSETIYTTPKPDWSSGLLTICYTYRQQTTEMHIFVIFDIRYLSAFWSSVANSSKTERHFSI